MNSSVQIISLIFSLAYGVFFSLLTILNFSLIKNMSIIIKNIITSMFVIDIVIIYVICLYHLNHGYFHLYFIIMAILGFLANTFIYHKKIVKKCKINNLKLQNNK